MGDGAYGGSERASGGGPASRRVLPCLVMALLLGGPASLATAEDLVSSSHRIVAGHVAVAASTPLTGVSTPPAYGGGGSVGTGAIGFTASPLDLTTVVAGFWPVVAGSLPGLDADGDGVRSYEDNCRATSNADQLDFDADAQGDACDADDDDDGLLDTVETGTGVYVSPSDTGTDALDPDSDGDTYPDGAEIAAGSDPNDALSTPLQPVPVPVLHPVLRMLVMFLLPVSALARLRRRNRRP